MNQTPQNTAPRRGRKTRAFCTDAVRQDLDIVGDEQSAPDPAAQPLLKTRAGAGGLPELLWKKGPYDGIRIQVDRGDGKGWVFLTYDSTPNYTDTAPLPAAPVKWKYRAIYRVGDAQVGLWSGTVEVTVGG